MQQRRRGAGNREDGLIRARDVWVALGNALVLAVLLAIIWRLRLLVSWTLVALLLALSAQPAVEWMTRHRVRRGIAVLVVCVGAVGTLALLLARLVPLLVEQAQALVARAPELLAGIERAEVVRWADERFGIVERAEQSLRDLGTHIAQTAFSLASTILQGIAGTVTILTLTVFMLLFGHDVAESCLAWLSTERRAHAQALGQRMRKMVGGYVLGSLLVAGVGGVVMALTMLALGVPYFLALGLLMVLFGLIPYLGSVLAAVLIVGVTLSSVGPRAALTVFGVYLVYQQVENHLLSPLVQRHTIQMNPLVITLALLAGAMLAGIRGTLLALPAAGAIQVLLQDALSRRHTRADDGAHKESGAPEAGAEGDDGPTGDRGGEARGAARRLRRALEGAEAAAKPRRK